MSRLIDAVAYSAKMKERQDETFKWKEIVKQNGDMERYHRALGSIATFVEAKLTLDNMPTVDAVEVVRCKECKYYYAGYECLAEGYGIEQDPNWFCAGGERRVNND